MTEHDPQQRALRQLVREARAERPADIDWTAVERRVLAQPERGAPPKTRSP